MIDDARDLTSGEPWDCGDLACDSCSLTALTQEPGEGRAAWLARLAARLKGHALSGTCTSSTPKTRRWTPADWERLLAEIAEGSVA